MELNKLKFSLDAPFDDWSVDAKREFDTFLLVNDVIAISNSSEKKTVLRIQNTDMALVQQSNNISSDLTFSPAFPRTCESSPKKNAMVQIRTKRG